MSLYRVRFLVYAYSGNNGFSLGLKNVRGRMDLFTSANELDNSKISSSQVGIPLPNSIGPFAKSSRPFNRYTYVYNNPVKFQDPTGHITCTSTEGPCRGGEMRPNGLVIYYLGGLGSTETIVGKDASETSNEYQYTIFALEEAFGEDSVHYVPVFTGGYERYSSQLDMIGEAISSNQPWTLAALKVILENPPYPGEEVILVGSSAGGTVAIELLDLLEDYGIFVDQVILRGSLVIELSLGNVGRVDYLAGDPPLSDIYYSIDVNPFDGVTVQQHIISGLTTHAPNQTENPEQVLRTIGALMVSLIGG